MKGETVRGRCGRQTKIIGIDADATAHRRREQMRCGADAAANAAVIDHIGGMEPEESIPLAPGAAAALARDALQMGQAAPGADAASDEREEMLPPTQPPGSAAALAREALARAAPIARPPGAAAATMIVKREKDFISLCDGFAPAPHFKSSW